MNIGIDIDGTITAAPEFFAALTQAFHAKGHAIFLITYRPVNMQKDTITDLRNAGIKWSQLIMAPEQIWVERIPPHVWKKEIAVRLGLDVFMDDDPDVVEAVPAKFKMLVV